MGTIIIKSILVVLLLLCLLPMPYVYYTILRVVMCLSILGAFQTEVKENEPARFKTVSCYILVFILFNPIFLIEFDKIVWNIIDVLLAIIIAISAIRNYREEYN
jgi:hypothetical protein